MKKKVNTIDVTPKWSDLIKLFEEWLASGNDGQKAIAHNELKKLADIADTIASHNKHGGLTCKCGADITFS